MALRLMILSLIAALVAAKTPIQPSSWPTLPFPFSTAIVSHSGAIHISGMQGFNFTAPKPGVVPGGIVPETAMVMANIAEVMKAAKGATMDDIMECLVILADLKDFDAFNGEYKKAFPAPMAPPSRVAYEAKLIGTAAVEIKCIGDVSKYGPW